VPKVTAEHREARRRQILDGARRAFGRFGYEGTTVPRLEEEIGLSRGAVFSYFPSKLDLFVALAEEDQSGVLEVWLEGGFDAVVRDVLARPEWIGVYLDVPRLLRADESLRERWRAFNPEGQARLSARLVELQEAGEIRSDLELSAIGSFLGAVLDGLCVHVGAGFEIDVDGTLELVRSALAPRQTRARPVT
jgi:TetR/AcrR family transcriptional regulator, transcriptional repressor of aconitase